ncbi:MAG: ATP-binding cassette domain-containing protein, partial [Alphaproteobacteria bacterium]|nr:ATP-binding cassette domain-containing protein [Alphaproteobacteria bacterium]
RKQRAREALRKVGLAERAKHKPTELSGGEQQRVAIARSFANDPAIILADEPTGNLDSVTGGEVLDFLRGAVDDLDQTLVVVTHDAGAAAMASSR